jgi:hypothetical protein
LVDGTVKQAISNFLFCLLHVASPIDPMVQSLRVIAAKILDIQLREGSLADPEVGLPAWIARETCGITAFVIEDQLDCLVEASHLPLADDDLLAVVAERA